MIELLFLTSLFLEAVRSPEPPNITRIVAEVTAYSSTVSQTDSSPEITASGARVREGIVACPRHLEFGTRVEIKGKTYTCLDRMALKNDGKFDIWFPDRKSAKAWGRQTLEVKVKE